jgi:hypothetical protein
MGEDGRLHDFGDRLYRPWPGRGTECQRQHFIHVRHRIEPLRS